MRYRVTSDQDRVVAGLGVFKKDEPQEFGPEANDSYMRIAGLPLNQSNTPEGVKVTILLDSNSEEG